ncbi:MAG: tRNA dihydrouridine synthase DusB [bacterium]
MKLGRHEILNPITLAPMEDVSDTPFRIICKRLGADILFTEFVNAEGLVRESSKTRKKMLFMEEERPFGIQIYGASENSMGNAACIAESYSPDFIDINCGCWVKDVALRGAGAGLLKDLPRMERIVSAVVKAVVLPVSVKTRLGWDEANINIVNVAKMLEQNGVSMLTIHCRTRDQGHKGDPDYSWIEKVKQSVSIPIIVNGSIGTPEHAKQVFENTGCDGIMIGRAAIDNPWIFNQIKFYLAHGALQPEPTIDEKLSILLEHLRLSVEAKGERRAVIEFRKYYSGYLKGMPNNAKLRLELMQYIVFEPIVEKLTHYVDQLKAEELTLSVQL